MGDKTKFVTISQVRKEITKAIPKTRIAELFQKSGLGVRELAGFARISPATASRIQRGMAPDIRTALRLAKFFETTVEELFKEFE